MTRDPGLSDHPTGFLAHATHHDFQRRGKSSVAPTSIAIVCNRPSLLLRLSALNGRPQHFGQRVDQVSFFSEKRSFLFRRSVLQVDNFDGSPQSFGYGKIRALRPSELA